MMSPTLFLPLTLLLLTQTLTITHAKKFDLEWFNPTSPDPSELFPDEMASVGDKVSFEWTQELPHNVVIHPYGGCNTTDGILVGNVFDETEYIFKDSDAGTTMIFACDYLSHCITGQIVKFTVAAAPTGSPTMKPVASPVAGTPTMKPVASPVAGTPTHSDDDHDSGDDDKESAGVVRGDGVRRVVIATMLVAVSLCVTVW